MFINTFKEIREFEEEKKSPPPYYSVNPSTVRPCEKPVKNYRDLYCVYFDIVSLLSVTDHGGKARNFPKDVLHR